MAISGRENSIVETRLQTVDEDFNYRTTTVWISNVAVLTFIVV
jgi:hypothetical protein